MNQKHFLTFKASTNEELLLVKLTCPVLCYEYVIGRPKRQKLQNLVFTGVAHPCIEGPTAHCARGLGDILKQNKDSNLAANN